MCERMFTPKAVSQTASSSSSITPIATPAFAQKRSTGPNASSARAIIASVWAWSETSAPKPAARSPSSPATASAASPSRSATSTPRAPSSTNFHASARPMPPAPPVTTATLPSSSMTRSYQLSVLDQSPISEGMAGADALHNTLDLARLADELGYHRYWLAEHHGGPMLAGPAPEVLIGPVAAATRRIRVGSGGVMLPHYSPLKVAENFSLLSALYPGRIDLGIGRRPGTDNFTLFALQRDRRDASPDDFPQQMAELMGYLNGTLPEDFPFARLTTLPGRPELPDVWLLGSSAQSAIWAAQLGLPYSFADFINARGSEIVEYYR